jgi:membrane-associated phospholipid phosphatase
MPHNHLAAVTAHRDLPAGARDGSNRGEWITLHDGYKVIPVVRRFDLQPWHLALLLLGVVSILPIVALVDPIAVNPKEQWPVWLQGAAARTTHFGKGQWWLVPAGLIAIGGTVAVRRFKVDDPEITRIVAYGWLFVVAVGGVSAFSALLKYLIGRARPAHFQELGPLHLNPLPFVSDTTLFLQASFASFPSGHATMVAAACTLIAMRWPRLRMAALMLALWLAFTRVVVGMHYPSDIMAGLLLGSFGVILVSAHFPTRLVAKLMGIRGREAPVTGQQAASPKVSGRQTT